MTSLPCLLHPRTQHLQAEQLAEAGLSASHVAATALSVLGKRQTVELGI